MVNTGDGVKEKGTVKSNTEARSQPSQKKEKGSTRKTEQPTTPEEAAAILLSALSYCRQAGLLIRGYNEKDELRLSIKGLNYADGAINPVPVVVSPVTRLVTRPEESHTTSHTTEKEVTR